MSQNQNLYQSQHAEFPYTAIYTQLCRICCHFDVYMNSIQCTYVCVCVRIVIFHLFYLVNFVLFSATTIAFMLSYRLTQYTVYVWKRKGKHLIFHIQIQMIHNGNGFVSCLRCLSSCTKMWMNAEMIGATKTSELPFGHIYWIEMRKQINTYV